MLFVRGGFSLAWESEGFLGSTLEEESSQCPGLRGQARREGLQDQEAMRPHRGSEFYLQVGGFALCPSGSEAFLGGNGSGVLCAGMGNETPNPTLCDFLNKVPQTLRYWYISWLCHGNFSFLFSKGPVSSTQKKNEIKFETCFKMAA